MPRPLLLTLPHDQPMTPELLAPAGTVPAFEAALAAGADAVYLGAPACNARALARDFSFAEIGAMIAMAHERGRKVYLAMNSLVKEQELPEAVTTLARLAALRADGLIVQDLGLLALAHRHFPELPLHASTLMAAHNSPAVACLAGLGCRRVVLARELSLAEIGLVARQAARLGVAIEVFIHGAMCFSYSGLCRFSSLHGGRSSLRGQCVQPCRRHYQWLASGQGKKGDRGSRGGAGRGRERPPQEGGYLFSMNDLSAVDQVDALARAGVASLKIEGRLKSVAYVAHTVRAYRLALDARAEPDERRRAGMLSEARAALDAAMGRRSGSGFFLPGAARSARLISPEQSGNTGTLVATLLDLKPLRSGNRKLVRVLARLQAPLRSGDRLRLHEERSDARIAFTLREFRAAGQSSAAAAAGATVEMLVEDAALLALRPPFHGKLYRVDVSGRKERPSPELAQLVARFGAEDERLRRLAQARAQALMPPQAERPPAVFRPARAAARARWWLRVATLTALRERLPFAVSRVLLDLNAGNLELALSGQLRRLLRGPKLSFALPPLMQEASLESWRANLARLQAAGYTSFQLGHPGQIRLFAQPEKLELFGDASFNLLNHQALAAAAGLGFKGLQFSLESDRETLHAALAARAAHLCAVGLLVYGRPALFTARAQSPHFQGRYALQSHRGERYALKSSEDGVSLFAREPLSLLAHGRRLLTSGLDYLVVDLSCGHPKQEAQLVTALWSGKGELPPHLAGNYNGLLA